uniref:Ubiquitin-like domain-containing protein n=1 Tax=Kalanchoe fedtschenkoi TaxID=63787 RepID=A0A7N0R8F8_KALFE
MGSHGNHKVDVLKVEETKSSEPTVEIKVKTLDSQTYTLRVDKCVPVPTLKDQIATVTGILSERQRLICRGRVLKDDQLLSAYHVEDGHTLHLVVREPIPPSQTPNDHSGRDYPPSAADAQDSLGGPRLVLGSFNVSDQGQGGMHHLSHIMSAVFGSMGNASDGGALEPPTIVVRRTSLLDSGGRQHASQGPTLGASLEHLHPPVVPDSLTTLSRYSNQMAGEFIIANVAGGDENAPFQGSPPFESDVRASEIARGALRLGLPTPESLSEVLQSIRRLLINETAASLSVRNVTDASARMSMQSNAMRLGIVYRNLGALLLELGRTTMMIRMGDNPADAVVNAGSAVFINESGPNPIMVQPFAMGSLPFGVGLGSSFIPRNVDIRSRTGAASETEQPGPQQPPEPFSQAATGTPSAAPILRQTEVHIRPIRAVFGAIPARTSQSLDPSRSATGLVFPLMARAQPSNGTGLVFPLMARAQPSYAGATDIGGQPGPGNGSPASAPQYLGELNFSPDNLLRSMLDIVDEQTTDTDVQPLDSAGASAAAAQPDPAPSDDGIFLSNLLQQIMPLISQNSASGSAGPSSASRRQSDQPPSPDSKRQRRE